MHGFNATHNTFILSICFSINMIADVFSSIIGFPYVVAIGTVSLFLVFLAFNRTFCLCRNTLLLIVAVFALFAISFISKGNIDYAIRYLIYFVVYGIFSAIFTASNFDEKLFFSILFSISFGYLVFVMFYYAPKILRGEISAGATMSISYLVLIGIVTGLYLFRSSKWFFKILLAIYLIIGIYYFIRINNNRGSILAILLFILMFTNLTNTRKMKTVSIALIASLTVLTIILFIPGVASNLDSFLAGSLNMRWNWIRRLLYQITRGNFLSGRNEILSLATILIKRSPIFGHGIGYFESITGGNYPHNIFVQISLEFGLVATFVFIYFMSVIFKALFDQRIDINKRMVLLLFFSTSIPRLLVSASYWELIPFWCMTFYSLALKDKSFVQI